jgi:N-acyl-D-aspartate/D-glutamate deacylase
VSAQCRPTRRNPLRSAPTAAWLTLLLAACPSATPHVDLIVRGAALVDGTGAARRRADIAVVAGRVEAVGDLGSLRARRVIDGTGLVVTPGFVDLHSHADLILLGDRPTQERLLAAKIAQGVTTLIVGNCGLGVAPASASAAEVLFDVNGWMTPAGVTAPPGSVGEYLDRLGSAGIALNVGTLVPHGPLRYSAVGTAAGPPSGSQLDAMRAGLADGLGQGAFGLSVGLIYPPGMYSSTDELVELARVVAASEGLVTAHVRGSSETLLPATRELIDVARSSGARVHHSHLEAVGEPFWSDVPRVLALEDDARAAGLAVSHDVFPYTRAATMMAAIFPPWALEGGIPALLARLADRDERERLRDELASRVPAWPPWVPGGWPHNLVGAVGWDGIRVASVESGESPETAGKSLADLAAERGGDPFDVVVDLMLAERGHVGQLVDEISGRGEEIEPLLAILAHPAAAVVSDAEDFGRGTPHPAHAGAFARALRLAREHSLMPLEEAVRRMTSYPASLLRVEDRGVIRPGAWADLVLLDPETVTDRATWEDPRRAAEGVRWVLINGRVAVEAGRYVGGLPGAVLRRARGTEHPRTAGSDPGASSTTR